MPIGVREAVFADGNDILFSAVSAYEMALKAQAGPFGDVDVLLSNYEASLGAAGWTELPLRSEHMLVAGSFPLTHRDPFDRMLAAQAICEDVVLVSRDKAVDQFGVHRLW